jgi:hypothetical protein
MAPWDKASLVRSASGKLRVVEDHEERKRAIERMVEGGKQKLSANFLMAHDFSQDSDWDDFTAEKPILIIKLDEVTEKIGLKSPSLPLKLLRAEEAGDVESTRASMRDIFWRNEKTFEVYPLFNWFSYFRKGSWVTQDIVNTFPILVVSNFFAMPVSAVAFLVRGYSCVKSQNIALFQFKAFELFSHSKP